MVARAKNYKAGFVKSDSNIRPDATLADVIALKEKTGHSTIAVTEDGTADGKLVGIVTSRDYRVSRMSPDTKVDEFMTSVFPNLSGQGKVQALRKPTILYGIISSILCLL